MKCVYVSRRRESRKSFILMLQKEAKEGKKDKDSDKEDDAGKCAK